MISDDAFAYRQSMASKDAVAVLDANQKLMKPHGPWQNGKVGRCNRTLATEWAYRQPFTSHQARADALAPSIKHRNTKRIRSSHGLTRVARVSPI